MNIMAKTSTTFTSRQFNQDTARAKRAAKDGPVFITTRGEPSYVLLTKQEYDRLKKAEETPPKKEFKSLAEALAQTEGGDFDYEFPEFKGPSSLKIPDLDD